MRTLAVCAGAAALLALWTCQGSDQTGAESSAQPTSGHGGASSSSSSDDTGPGGYGGESPKGCTSLSDCGACVGDPTCGYCEKIQGCIGKEFASLCDKPLVVDKTVCDAVGGDPPSPCDGYATCGSCVAAQDASCGWCAGVCRPGAAQMFGSFDFPYCTNWVRDADSCDGLKNSDEDSRLRGLFGAGQLPAETLEDDLDGLKKNIRWIVVIVQENHSMDNMFGFTKLPEIESLRSPTSPPLPMVLPPWALSYSLTKLLGTGPGVLPYRLKSACLGNNPGHQWAEMHTEWALGSLLGFAANGPFTMGFYLDGDHPLYTKLAKEYATSDQYFASVLGGTWANRDYLALATSEGIKSTGGGVPKGKTLMDELNDAQVPWVYAQKSPGAAADVDGPMEGCLGPARWSDPKFKKHVIDYKTLLSTIDKLDPVGDDPGVFLVDGGGGYDEHPGWSNVHKGEAFVHEVLRHLSGNSKFAWLNTAVLVTYDESGGYMDHVAPPSVVPPDDSQLEFHYLGFRVPFFVVSPWARKSFVSHKIHSHTSITRFIQARFGLPALTRRDANSDALLDMFDFTGKNAVGFLSVPLLPPGPGVADDDDAKRVWPGPVWCVPGSVSTEMP